MEKARLVLDTRGTLMSQVNARHSPKPCKKWLVFTGAQTPLCGSILGTDGSSLRGGRLYANSCKHKGVKDLSVLGRPMERVMIIDDSFKMKGHQIEGSGRINALGKLLCKILRHRAVELGLHIRNDGYCKVDDLLKLDIKTRSKLPLSSHSLADVLEAVEQNTKQRLSTMVDEDNLVYIQASQGHSLKEVLSQELVKEIKSPDEVAVCVHGTSETAMDSIIREGLKVMRRKCVHFATGLPEDGGVISGMRSSCEVLMYLDVKKAMEDGMKLYMSDNGVVLTEGFQGTVACSYFEKIVRLSKCPI